MTPDEPTNAPADVEGSNEDGEIDPSSDPLFGLDRPEEERRSDIFANKELLTINTVPDSDRIVGRDDRMDDLGSHFENVMPPDPSDPGDIMIYGKTGTGKTLVSRHVTDRAVTAARSKGVQMGSFYLKSRPQTTDTQTYRLIGQRIKQQADELGRKSAVEDIKIPDTGLATERYFELIWEVVDAAGFQSVVIIIDELDKHGDLGQLLYDLSRVGDRTDAFVTIIGITNRLDFSAPPRADSTFKPTEYLFKPYSQSQLIRILQHRLDAFHDGVLDENVIEKAAQLAADEHGDARAAVASLRRAGELADDDEEQLEPHVTVEHVERGRRYVEMDRFRDQIAKSSTHTHLLLYALARLTESKEDRTGFPTSDIEDRYTMVANDLGIDPLGTTSINKKLRELAMLGIVESANDFGGRHGNKRVHELMQDTNLVKNAILRENSDLKAIMESGF